MPFISSVRFTDPRAPNANDFVGLNYYRSVGCLSAAVVVAAVAAVVVAAVVADVEWQKFFHVWWASRLLFSRFERICLRRQTSTPFSTQVSTRVEMSHVFHTLRRFCVGRCICS